MIEVEGLRKTFPGRGGLLGRAPLTALRGATFTLPDAGVIAVIGESGSGKTTLGRILAGLEAFDGGRLAIDGVRVDELPARSRGAHFQKIQLIHQDPYAALNPTRTIEQTLTAPLRLEAGRQGSPAGWLKRRQRELLGMVGLDWRAVLGKYPHELSGGQRQRVVIARALTVGPGVLVADEAVSMIDVSLRLGILKLLQELREQLGLGMVFITHDVTVARYVAYEGDICVLYRGEIVEKGPAETVLRDPLHPYTQALLSAVPVIHGVERPGLDRFIPLRPLDERAGGAEHACPFAPRCPFARQRCHDEHPELEPATDPSHVHACFFPTPRQVSPLPV